MQNARAVLAWRTREARRPDPTSKRAIIGGPWDGQSVLVRSNMMTSLDLVIRGQRGRFVHDRNQLRWVAQP